MQHSEGGPTHVAERSEDGWVYVSGPMRSADRERAVSLYDRLSAACEESGWHVYRPYREIAASESPDGDPLFDRLRHAVRHAQACVVYIGAPSSGVGAELALAREGGRPIIAITMEGDEMSPVLDSMLRDYERALIVRGADEDDCVSRLLRAMSDPEWMRVVQVAASEHAEDL